MCYYDTVVHSKTALYRIYRPDGILHGVLHDHLRHRAEAGRIVRARISAGDPVNVGRVPTGLPADLLLHHTPCPEICLQVFFICPLVRLLFRALFRRQLAACI